MGWSIRRLGRPMERPRASMTGRVDRNLETNVVSSLGLGLGLRIPHVAWCPMGCPWTLGTPLREKRSGPNRDRFSQLFTLKTALASFTSIAEQSSVTPRVRLPETPHFCASIFSHTALLGTPTAIASYARRHIFTVSRRSGFFSPSVSVSVGAEISSAPLPPVVGLDYSGSVRCLLATT